MKFYKDKLISIRKSKFLSQSALAQLSSYSRKTISRWENSETYPKEGDVRKLAEALNISVENISDLAPVYSKSNIDISPLASSNFLLSNQNDRYNDRIGTILNETLKLKKELEITSILTNTLLSAATFAFYIKDNEQNYITANSKFVKNLGLLPDYNVLGKKDINLYSNKEAKKNTLEDKEVLESGTAKLNNENYIPGSRKSKWGLISKIPIFDSNSNISGIIGIFVDITERKKTEEKVNALYNALYNLSNGAGIIFGKYLDSNHNQLQLDFFSKSLMEFANLAPEHFLDYTRVWEKLIHPDSLDYFIEENKKQWGKPIQTYELQLVNQITKEPKWFNYTYYEENDYCLSIFLPSNKAPVSNELNSVLFNILNNSDDSIRIVQLNPLRFIFLSKSIEKLFGYPLSKFTENLEFRRRVCVHPDDREKENSYVRNNKFPSFRVYRIIKPDNSITVIEETTIQIKNHGVDYIIAISKEMRKS